MNNVRSHRNIDELRIREARLLDAHAHQLVIEDIVVDSRIFRHKRRCRRIVVMNAAVADTTVKAIRHEHLADFLHFIAVPCLLKRLLVQIADYEHVLVVGVLDREIPFLRHAYCVERKVTSAMRLIVALALQEMFNLGHVAALVVHELEDNLIHKIAELLKVHVAHVFSKARKDASYIDLEVLPRFLTILRKIL